MKRYLKILVLALVVVFCLGGLVACNADGSGSSNENGLLVKKFSDDSYWTVYGYEGEDEEIDVESMAKDEDGNPVVIGRILTGAFKNADKTKRVIVPSTVEVIDEGAFKDMNSLEEITLPFIGKTAIADSQVNETEPSEDKSVDAERTFGYIFGTEEYSAGYLFTQIYNTAEGSSNSYYIPKTLKKINVSPKAGSNYKIPMFAFACGDTNWPLIEKVNLSSDVKVIGEYAFYRFKGLSQINLDGITQIKKCAFSNCSNLKTVAFGTDLISIGDYAFEKAGVRAVEVISVATTIGNYAFANSLVENATIGAQVISEGVFSNCERLSKVTISHSSATIKAFAFSGCTNLSSIGAYGTADKTANFTGFTVENNAFAKVDKDNFNTITGLTDIDSVFVSVK